MAGAVYGFTPNMSQDDVTELDRRRGLGDHGAFNDPDILVNKRPWLRPDGTHKSSGDEKTMSKTAEATETLKAMKVPTGGEPFGKCGCSGPCDHQKESAMKCMDGLKKYAGKTLGPRGMGMEMSLDSEKDDVSALEALLEHEKKEAKEEVEKMLPGELSKPSPLSSDTTAVTAASTTPAPPPATPPPATASNAMAMKSLNTRSFFIPPPLQAYDPYGVNRNATTIPVSRAAIGEGSERSVQPDVFKSCTTHGVTFRASQGCHPCNVQKSLECKECGSGMMKSFGGVYRCPRGH
jgi:hypothetical protein